MKKILLIEDNKDISDSIKEYLELEDFQIDSCYTGDEGLDQAMNKTYDMLLLDVMLPKVDGFTIAAKLHEKSDVPVVMITAKDAIDDKLLGFENGVQDYIVKPFDLRELEARINSIFRRNERVKEYIFEDIKINLEKRLFSKNDVEISVTQKEFLIVELLLKNEGKPVSRTDIIEHGWGGGDALFDSDAKLDVYISNLRNKLNRGFIKTIKGFGYKID
ncbi:MAG: response regulator transcription factor [Candidatus Gracilibacteria bacterium]|nr:response regulator transcription factor [Candidatus Gracilibacteria bacterium]